MTTLQERKEKAYQRYLAVLARHGFTMIGNYNGAMEPVEIECPNGHRKSPIPAMVRDNLSFGCHECIKEQAKRNFLANLQRKEYVLLEDYVNMNTGIEVQCKYGHKWKIHPFQLNKNDDYNKNTNKSAVKMWKNDRFKYNTLIITVFENEY